MIDTAERPTCRAAGCTHPQSAGTQLCATDAVQLGDWIARIGDEYDALDAAPSLQAPAAGSTGGGGLKSHRSVGDLDVMVLRDPRSRAREDHHDDPDRGRGVLEVLGYWADWIRAELDLPGPTRPAVAAVHTGVHAGPVCPVYAGFLSVRDFLPPCRHRSCQQLVQLVDVPAYPTVATERAFLSRSRHLSHALAQDWAGAFFDEVRTIWSRLRAANGHEIAQPRPRCPSCGAAARWAAGTVVCPTCGTSTSGLAVLRQHTAAGRAA